ncbi:arylsulfatase [Rhodococcus sp. NPDC058481]|uniref:arylsulfatase n=1 Tax=unclassified Rhodococcus (in: high G+C Gram-positive bacteria) TaxID=192944 RepID=UPI003656F2A0
MTAENTEFPGRITTSLSTSEPWWPPRTQAPADAPNVVVMIVDDMGYSDIAPFGSEIPTPHLDAVAEEGVRMSDFHVTSMCSPTRAALLTGCNAHAVGVGAVCNTDPGFPGYAGELPADQPTLAEMLRGNGYSTLMIGKWHLCKESDLNAAGDRHSWPLQRGFDQFYGFLEAQTNFHHPHQLYEGNNPLHVDDYPEGYYLTDDLTRRATEMICDSVASDPDKPFLLYYAHGAVHTPLHAKDSYIESFRGAYEEGWDAIRHRRFTRQQELGLIPRSATLAPLDDPTGPDVPAWADLGADGQRLAARYMEVYAAMVTSIDESVGRIREVLDRLGQLDNTVFVFLSDNGAAGDGGTDIGVFNHLGNLDRSAKRTVAQRLPVELARIDEIGGPTSWPAIPVGWATTSNTPFRRHKFSTFRGGHQVPFLISWPRGLDGVGGEIRHQYAHVTDVVPTLMDLIGLPVTLERHGRRGRDLDGVSLVPTLRSADHPSDHREQYYESFGDRAYLREGWEAVSVRTPLTPFRDDRWELFDLSDDLTQCRDLAAEHPERVAELVRAWEEAAGENQVLPMADGTPLHWFQRPPHEQRFARPVTLLPCTPTLERFRSGHLIDGRSFEIVVDLEAFTLADSGVLVSHGGQEGGYVLYVEDGFLHFVENAFSRMIEAPPVRLPAQCSRITVAVTAPGKARWSVEIRIDDEVVLRSDDFIQLSWLVPYNGINVGVARRSPVSWELARKYGTFRYSGRIAGVTYVPGDLAPDAFPMMIDHFRELGMATQ